MVIIPKRIVFGFVVLSLTAIAGTVIAQSANPAMKDISPCMQITGNAEKLACYLKLETEVHANRANVTANTAPSAVTLSTSPAPAPAPAVIEAKPASALNGNDAVASFGNKAATSETAPVRPDAKGTLELHDSIAEIKEREPNRWLITLANGQIWYQSNSQQFRLLKGMAVRIYPSPLHGSYRLARDDGTNVGFIQVERIK